eukprot:TRINITY_DN11751_c0_g1_i1.p1 TRINITY_DN11751_c0_g1~~TRINITY_DN11751_c0_g1_i1.p1  ORF type:complete len:882 (-),score=268.25 TRINITY_DN11751_c0_g1_i1:68-2713(-)
MWKQIQPYEFLNSAWTAKGEERERAKNILRFIERSTYISNWVASTICRTGQLKYRTKICAKWIDVSYKLKNMGNFNGCMAIMAAFNLTPVFRLKQTFEIIQTQSKVRQQLSELKELLDHAMSYSNLRKAIKSVDPPVIPFLGMYLTDLTFIHEGNPNEITEHKLINFHKRRLISEKIRDIQTYQQKSYNFTEVLEIKKKLSNESVLLEKDLYELSYYVEPKEGAERGEKPLILKNSEIRSKKNSNVSLESSKQWSLFEAKDPKFFNFNKEKQEIVSGTLEKVIGRLTHWSSPDTRSMEPFIAVCRTFCSVEKILDLIILRYTCLPEPKDKSEETMEFYIETIKNPLCLRIVTILKYWLSTHWYDFQENEALIEKVKNFAESLSSQSTGTQQGSGQSLLKIIQKQTSLWKELASETEKNEEEKIVEARQPPTRPPPLPPGAKAIIPKTKLESIVNQKLSIVNFEAEDIAKQLTRMLSKLYLKMKPEELLPRMKNRDNLVEIIRNYVYTERWIEKELDMAVQKNQVSIIVPHIVNIAKVCASLNNWHSVEPIINSLIVAKSKHELTYPEEEMTFINTTESFIFGDKLKQHHFNLQPPSIPLLKEFRRAIVADYFGDTTYYFQDNIINMTNIRKIGDTLVNFVKTQTRPFDFEEKSDVQRYLKHRLSDFSAPIVDLDNVKSDVAAFSVGEVKEAFAELATDPEFHKIVDDIARYTIEREYQALQQEFIEMVNGQPVVNIERNKLIKIALETKLAAKIGIQHKSSNKLRLDSLPVQTILQMDFPGFSLEQWRYFDAQGTVSGKGPEDITIDYFKIEGYLAIVQVGDEISLEDISRLLKLAKLFQKEHEDLSSSPNHLCCLLITRVLTPDVAELVEKYKIKVKTIE